MAGALQERVAWFAPPTADAAVGAEANVLGATAVVATVVSISRLTPESSHVEVTVKV